MNGGQTDSDSRNPDVMAAVMAAVQTYLEDETSAAAHQSSRSQRAWKTAAWRQPVHSRPRRRLPWNGRVWGTAEVGLATHDP